MTEINLNEWQKLMEDFDLKFWVFRHITYKEKIDNSINELFNTDPNKIVKWGWRVFDNLLWWIYWWKIYTIGAESWSWKSTFVNQLCLNLSNQNIKTTKYSLEDRLEDIWKEELFYFSNRLLKAKWEKLFNRNSFNNWEYTHKNWNFYKQSNIEIIKQAQKNLERLQITELEKNKKVSINDLIELMQKEVDKWTKVFIIDHLHYFEHKATNRLDIEIENVMHNLNEVARKNNITIFLVAHYKKLWKEEPNNDSFKDASAIKQVSNIIIHIIRDFNTDKTQFKIKKIRWPIKQQNIEAIFDIETYTYKDFILLEK